MLSFVQDFIVGAALNTFTKITFSYHKVIYDHQFICTSKKVLADTRYFVL